MSTSLSKFFQGIGAKRLAEVEVNPDASNQHEFNGIGEFKKILGSEKRAFKGKFILLSDEEEKTVFKEGDLTWYDARENHEKRTEYRLYYSDSEILKLSETGDLVVIGKLNEAELAVIVAPRGSTSEKQLLWLFGLKEVENKFLFKDLTEQKTDIGFAERKIISYLGIEIEEEETNDLDLLLKTFNNAFPTTAAFSDLSRSLVKNVSPVDDPDGAILAWLQKEENLFKTLEKHFVAQKLNEGFGKETDAVEEFISFSLSVQNRRKSRAGHSFENHLAVIFTENKVRYSNGKKTEGNYKPDFLFPGVKEYHEEKFNIQLLTMLGVKTTAKDRWRQILSEAKKILAKHLITLEPAISKNQTDQMRDEQVQLVVPKEIISTYNEDQQKEIIPLRDFLKLVLDKQNSH